MSVTSIDKDLNNLTITVVADFKAPVERVWQLWADPSQLEKWWGPPGYETLLHEMEVEPDGKTRLVTRDPDGREHPTTLVYAGIKAAHSLSYMQSDDSDPTMTQRPSA